MKRIISSYTSFTRTERMGVLGLCLGLVVVITIYATLPYFSSPKQNPARQQELVAAWNSRQEGAKKTPVVRQQSITTEQGELMSTNKEDMELRINSTRPSSKSNQSWFDPNTADSATLRSFGMRPVAISNLLKWRAKGKRFYQPGDLRPLYTLTEAEYRALEPHIAITPLLVDLNTADSATLLRLRGIGPKLAHKIIRRRNQTPFTSHEQLRDIYDFPDSVFARLKTELKPLGE